MALFVIAGILLAIVVTVLLAPLLRRPSTDRTTGEEREVQIYRDQLDEVGRDLSRGVLTPGQAASARIEIERRLLSAARRRDAAAPGQSKTGRLLIAIGVAAMPLLAGSLYFTLGAPDQSAQPFRSRTASTGAEPRAEDTAAIVENLRAQLMENPENPQGFALLGRALAQQGRYDEAASAYAEANRLVGGENPALAGAYAEMLVMANNGTVPPVARDIFTRLRETQPNDPQTRYYLALAAAQAGDAAGALEDLRALRDAAPADAPWRDAVSALIAELSARETPSTPPTPAPGPTEEQVAAASEMTPQARQAMIDGMVNRLAARLEENPDDLDGWRRLARAYAVLGEREKATAAYREVLARAPDDEAAQAFFREN